MTPAGALFWPAARLLAVSDLHFEKGSSAAARGNLLPPWDTHATLDRLAGLLRRYSPRVVVALGDSFHDRDASGRLPPRDARPVAGDDRPAEQFVWVQGNHDPHPPAGLGGEAVAFWQAGPLLFRHQAVRGSASGEISGHHHPKAQVPARGGSVSRACFVTDGRRLMLPALGAYTGGLDVRTRPLRACSRAAGGCSCSAATGCSAFRWGRRRPSRGCDASQSAGRLVYA